MTSYVNLSDVQKKFNYTWTVNGVNDYYNQSYADSPQFWQSNDANIKFFLRLSGKYVSYSITYYTIYLCLQTQQRELPVHYKIAILDSIGQKRNPHEGRALFSYNPNSPNNREARDGWEYKISKVYLSEQNLMPGNQLKVFCEVFVLDSPNVQVIDADISKLNEPKNQVLEDYEALLKSGDLSDVVLVCGRKGKSKEFNLHKNILAARSPVFSAMFNCDMVEKKKNRVVITDLAAEVCELLLPYIYTGKIPSMKDYGLELFFASDKYQLDHLKAICERTLITTLSVQTVANTLLMADMHSAALLKKKCIEYITRNSEQVMVTKGWAEMTKRRPELLMELYKDISSKANPFLKN